MGEKVYLVKEKWEPGFGCAWLILATIVGIIYGIKTFFKYMYDEIGLIGILLFFGRIVLIIFLIIFIVHKIKKRKRKKEEELRKKEQSREREERERKKKEAIIQRYQTNNPDLNITEERVKRKIYLDNENKLIILFVNDNEGKIVKLPYSELRSYEIEKRNINIKLTIKTNLDDPNLSILHLYLDRNIRIDNIEKELEYVFGRQLKGED